MKSAGGILASNSKGRTMIADHATAKRTLAGICAAFGCKEPIAATASRGMRCCDDCQRPAPGGPMLPDELWATIAKPNVLLCLRCIERRLGRHLTQADLTLCPFNAGWIPVSRFAGDDAAAAAQFARGRKPLPFEVIE
jgi:hypothetical protein